MLKSINCPVYTDCSIGANISELLVYVLFTHHSIHFCFRDISEFHATKKLFVIPIKPALIIISMIN